MKNYIEIEEACNYPWVTTKEIKVILGGVGDSKANNFRMMLEEKLNKEYANAMLEKNEKLKEKMLSQCFYFKDSKPHRLPIKRVLEEAHLDLDIVRREANKMRKSLKFERKEVDV